MAVSAFVFLLAVVSTAPSRAEGASVESMLAEESPDVFLAKATLQQYLSRIVRKDWDGVRRLTHPRAMAAIESGRKRRGNDPRSLAPWADDGNQLKTFEFRGARQVSPGVVMVAVGEDLYHADDQGMSTGAPAVYVLFKSRNGFLVGDKIEGVGLGRVSGELVRNGYPGWVDHQVQAQAKRAEAIRNGKHR
jgi:hypothetical protein